MGKAVWSWWVVWLVLAAPAARAWDEQSLLRDQKKGEILLALADCETHGRDPGAGPYVGRYQFSTLTVISFVRERDGRTLTAEQARLLARDTSQSASLAAYIIFERGGWSHWPACSHKLGLSRKVAALRAL